MSDADSPVPAQMHDVYFITRALRRVHGIAPHSLLLESRSTLWIVFVVVVTLHSVTHGYPQPQACCEMVRAGAREKQKHARACSEHKPAPSADPAFT